MNQHTKKQLNLWLTWNYEKQQQRLDALSERGSDKESLQQHYRRIQRVLFAVLVAEAIVLSVNVNNYFTISSHLHHVAPVYAALFVLLGVVILILAHGCIVLSGKMRRIRQPNP